MFPACPCFTGLRSQQRLKAAVLSQVQGRLYKVQTFLVQFCVVWVSSSIVIEALCHKPKVASSRPHEVNEFIYLIFPAALGFGIHSSNRNEYQEQKHNVSGE
jgi:hypothetical protein